EPSEGTFVQLDNGLFLEDNHKMQNTNQTQFVSEARKEEAELIARIKDGDEFAFLQLTNQFSERLYRKALSMVSNPDDAQDVLQDAYLSAYRAFANFRAESGVYTWLYRIV